MYICMYGKMWKNLIPKTPNGGYMKSIISNVLKVKYIDKIVIPHYYRHQNINIQY